MRTAHSICLSRHCAVRVWGGRDRVGWDGRGSWTCGSGDGDILSLFRSDRDSLGRTSRNGRTNDNLLFVSTDGGRHDAVGQSYNVSSVHGGGNGGPLLRGNSRSNLRGTCRRDRSGLLVGAQSERSVNWLAAGRGGHSSAGACCSGLFTVQPRDSGQKRDRRGVIESLGSELSLQRHTAGWNQSGGGVAVLKSRSQASDCGQRSDNARELHFFFSERSEYGATIVGI